MIPSYGLPRDPRKIQANMAELSQGLLIGERAQAIVAFSCLWTPVGSPLSKDDASTSRYLVHCKIFQEESTTKH